MSRRQTSRFPRSSSQEKEHEEPRMLALMRGSELRSAPCRRMGSLQSANMELVLQKLTEANENTERMAAKLQSIEKERDLLKATY